VIAPVASGPADESVKSSDGLPRGPARVHPVRCWTRRRRSEDPDFPVASRTSDPPSRSFPERSSPPCHGSPGNAAHHFGYNRPTADRIFRRGRLVFSTRLSFNDVADRSEPRSCSRRSPEPLRRARATRSRTPSTSRARGRDDRDARLEGGRRAGRAGKLDTRGKLPRGLPRRDYMYDVGIKPS